MLIEVIKDALPERRCSGGWAPSSGEILRVDLTCRIWSFSAEDRRELADEEQPVVPAPTRRYW